MNQAIDYHAILPEMILSGTILLVLVADSFLVPQRKWLTMPLGVRSGCSPRSSPCSR